MPLLPADMDDRGMLKRVLGALETRAGDAGLDAVARELRGHLALSSTNKCRMRLVVDVACATRDGARVEEALSAVFDKAVSGGLMPRGVASDVLRWKKTVLKLEGE